MKNALRLSLALVLCAPSAPAFAAAAAAGALAQIGAAAAVRGAVKAAAPGAVGRVIGSGKPLYLNDHVTTDGEGRLQILLLDETVFTIGPNADMVLDEFVYDPATGGGKVAANITKGAFRFVTGKVARKNPENMNVKLAVGTIGIRGTVVVGETGKDGSTVINAGAAPGNNADEPPSAISVANAGKKVVSNRSGEGIKVLPGGVPSSPVEMHGDLDRISGVLSPKTGRQAGKGGDAGGATKGSGQSTAKGRDLAAGDLADLGSASAADAVQSGAEQQGVGNVVPDGKSDWSQLAKLAGTGVYNGAGTYTCSGTTCNGSNTLSFVLNVNFDSKVVTGGSITLATGGSTNPVSPTDTLTGSPAFPSSGNALLTVGGAGGITHTNTEFNNTTFQFSNSGGIAAKSVKMNLAFNDFSNTVSGSATGTR